ncbi:hypothetical protein [Desulfogranum marinum]|uniref:CIS tube protein n=1 Tax=Desulfogranum marinum TaxID=453220 RepID=UPI0029C77E80|nr:hypothetical protein [Desulfogranum marinum]
MPHLEKAKLEPVRADRNNSSAGDEMEVQFNPTSLKLRLTNQTEGGRARGRQRRQHTGTSSTVLTLQLIFDSTDETTGSVENPQAVSVRKKTSMVEQFVVPKSDGSETPPLVKFSWNELVIIGIIENVDIDFDFFAADGVPLRAKVSLSIKEQDRKYQYLETGAGSRDNANARTTGTNSLGQPGSSTNDTYSSVASDRSAAALDGETAAEFAARMGLDPYAWRGLDVDLSAGLSLEAGLEVGFSAGLSLNAGIGFSAGFQAGAEVSLEASFGLEAKAGVNASMSANLSANVSAGFALSAAGGVGAAIESVKSLKAQTAAEEARESFRPTGSISMAASSAAPEDPTSFSSATSANMSTPAMVGATSSNASHQTITASSGIAFSKSLQQSTSEHSPLTTNGFTTYSQQQAAPSAPPISNADKRATGFGYGVPLRPQIKTTLPLDQPRICSLESCIPTGKNAGPKFSSDPTLSPWIKLPVRNKSRKLADEAKTAKQAHACGVLYTNKRKGGTW